MPSASKADAAAIFDLKSAALTLIAVQLKTSDLGLLAAELQRRFGDAGPFDGDPVAIDLAPLREADAPVDFEALLSLLRRHRMQPLAVQGGSAAQMAAAFDAGLVEAAERPAAAPRADTSTPRADTSTPRADTPPPRAEAAPPSPQAPAEPPAAPAPQQQQALGRVPPLVVDKPLRSGQQVYARGGDLVVLAVVSFGAEVIADGSIHVYAPLRGRALAGAMGDTSARIYAARMEPQLLSIAGMYRTTETELPADVRGRPAQVRLEGERLLVEPLEY